MFDHFWTWCNRFENLTMPRALQFRFISQLPVVTGEFIMFTTKKTLETSKSSTELSLGELVVQNHKQNTWYNWPFKICLIGPKYPNFSFRVLRFLRQWTGLDHPILGQKQKNHQNFVADKTTTRHHKWAQWSRTCPSRTREKPKNFESLRAETLQLSTSLLDLKLLFLGCDCYSKKKKKNEKWQNIFKAMWKSHQNCKLNQAASWVSFWMLSSADLMRSFH